MNIYSPLHPAAFFMIQRRQRLIRGILARMFPDGVEKIRLLEIGCGNGQWLTEFQMFGFRSSQLAGIELDPQRAETAHMRIPDAEIRQGDAGTLPWDAASFDLVFQSTVFTSVPDAENRQQIATEMKRVCKPGGMILWYDFIYNSPSNPDVRGIGRAEVRKLFAPWSCTFRAVTLAPPISRRLAPVSWIGAEITESLFPFLCTHVLAEIRQ